MVRFTYKYLKPVALFLSIVVLFQCCRICKIYDKHSVQIEEAIGIHENGVKIILKDDREFIFNSLYYDDDILYGEIRKPKAGQEVTVEINQDSIKEIHPYSKKKSTIANSAVTIVVIGTIIGIIVYTMNHMWD